MPPRSDISVVIPVRNGEAFICAAVDSVLAQSGFAPEIIVVDNNSTDATVSLVAARYGERVIVVHEQRPNAANARNAGAAVASANWLAFLDADDLWLPGKLHRQMTASEQHPEAHLFFTLGEEFHSPELRPEERSRVPCRPQPYPMLTPASLLLKREVFHGVGNFPNVPGGEFIAWFGWARELGFKDFVVPEVLVRRRIHARNTTRGGALAGYPLAAKWLLDRRRDAQARVSS